MWSVDMRVGASISGVMGRERVMMIQPGMVGVRGQRRLLCVQLSRFPRIVLVSCSAAPPRVSSSITIKSITTQSCRRGDEGEVGMHGSARAGTRAQWGRAFQ